MTAFLTFSLAAPLASFGGVAVGERRSGGDRPAKSAILGLVAAALGIERSDHEVHAALAREFFYAVRTENMKVRSPGRLMTDYHTVQTPPRARNQLFATRREEVADKKNLGTILSYREYRSDCAFSIALWLRAGASRFSLEEIEAALRLPVYVPYMGRKACPLMLPMRPRIVEAGTIREAFVKRDEGVSERERKFLEKQGLLTKPAALAADADAEMAAEGSRRERRRDAILDRCRWQFGLRDETVSPWKGDAA